MTILFQSYTLYINQQILKINTKPLEPRFDTTEHLVPNFYSTEADSAFTWCP